MTGLFLFYWSFNSTVSCRAFYLRLYNYSDLPTRNFDFFWVQEDFSVLNIKQLKYNINIKYNFTLYCILKDITDLLYIALYPAL